MEFFNHIIAENIYGNCIASDHDRKTLQALADRFCNENVNHDDYKFFEALDYRSVPTGNHMWYLEMINRLPDYDPPELFGISHYEIDF